MDALGDRGVLVVGAGPAGLAAALELARLHRPVRIVDAKPAPSAHSKAIGINARTLELLEPSGVTERLLEQGRRIPGIDFRTEDRLLFRLRFAELRHRYNFMLGLPQSETEHAIEQRLGELGVEVERGASLEGFEQGDGVVVANISTADGKTAVEAAYLIGADGAHSVVRDRLGIAFPGETMPGDWSLADVLMDSPLDDETANVLLQPDGMLFLLRIKDRLFRLASNRTDVIDRLPKGSRLHRVVWRSDFTVSHRQAERYGMGRVFLAGDAAHVHSPLGARGMNMGIEDATDLARRIAGGGLDRYHADRRRAGASAIRMVKAQTRLATSTGLPARLVRHMVIPALLSIGAVRRRFLRRALGLGHG